MSMPKKISPHDAHIKVAGGSALLVCSYDDDGKCRDMLLEGAMLLSTFKGREPSLPGDAEIIFYCG